MVNDLLPCPFCGGKALLCDIETELEGEMFSGFIVACEHCGISTPASEDKQTVLDCWNKRSPSERENELEKLLSILVDAHYYELSNNTRKVRAILQAKELLN